MLAMDAIFGLPRKKVAGVSCEDPLFGSLFFSDQSSVDEFVSSYGNTKDTPSVSTLLVF